MWTRSTLQFAGMLPLKRRCNPCSKFYPKYGTSEFFTILQVLCDGVASARCESTVVLLTAFDSGVKSFTFVLTTLRCVQGIHPFQVKFCGPRERSYSPGNLRTISNDIYRLFNERCLSICRTAAVLDAVYPCFPDIFELVARAGPPDRKACAARCRRQQRIIEACRPTAGPSCGPLSTASDKDDERYPGTGAL